MLTKSSKTSGFGWRFHLRCDMVLINTIWDSIFSSLFRLICSLAYLGCNRISLARFVQFLHRRLHIKKINHSLMLLEEHPIFLIRSLWLTKQDKFEFQQTQINDFFSYGFIVALLWALPCLTFINPKKYNKFMRNVGS